MLGGGIYLLLTLPAKNFCNHSAFCEVKDNNIAAHSMNHTRCRGQRPLLANALKFIHNVVEIYTQCHICRYNVIGIGCFSEVSKQNFYYEFMLCLDVVKLPIYSI